MPVQTLIKKLTSRKLWVAIAGIATGMCTILGGDTSDAQVIAGAIVALASVMQYIHTEGRIDAAGVANAIQQAQKAKEVLLDDEQS